MIRTVIFLCALTATSQAQNIFDLGNEIGKGLGQFGNMFFGGISNVTNGIGKAIETVANNGVNFIKQVPLIGPMAGAVVDTVKNTAMLVSGPDAMMNGIMDFLKNLLGNVFGGIGGAIQKMFPTQHLFLANGGTFALIAGAIMLVLSNFIK